MLCVLLATLLRAWLFSCSSVSAFCRNTITSRSSLISRLAGGCSWDETCSRFLAAGVCSSRCRLCACHGSESALKCKCCRTIPSCSVRCVYAGTSQVSVVTHVAHFMTSDALPYMHMCGQVQMTACVYEHEGCVCPLHIVAADSHTRTTAVGHVCAGFVCVLDLCVC